MLAPGSGCKYRLSLAERFDCAETIINQLLADSYQNPISEWHVKTSSRLPLILHYGELYNYFIIYYKVIIEIKCTINVMCLNHPKTIPPPPDLGLWKNCLPRSWSLVPKRWGTAGLYDLKFSLHRDFPGGPVVENPPSNTGDIGLIPGWGTKIPHAMGHTKPARLN